MLVLSLQQTNSLSVEYLTHQRLVPDVRCSIQVENNCQIVGIVRGIELCDVEHTLSAQAVAKVARIQSRKPVIGQLPRDAVDIGAESVLGLGPGEEGQKPYDQERGVDAVPCCHGCFNPWDLSDPRHSLTAGKKGGFGRFTVCPQKIDGYLRLMPWSWRERALRRGQSYRVVTRACMKQTEASGGE